jgi:hypothetical protein
MSSVIKVRHSDTTILLSGVPLTHFPDTGSYLTFEPSVPDASMTTGLNETAVVVVNDSTKYIVAITVIPGTKTDAILSGARRVQRQLSSILSFSASWPGSKFTSITFAIISVASRELAADSQPVVVYTCEGLFPIADVFALAAPENITADQLLAAVK